MHWSIKYIGRPYVSGSADCARLISDVRVNEFGLPVPEVVDIQRKESRLGRAGQLSDLIYEYGVQTIEPSDGDVVLMICAGRPSHAGVYCEISGDSYVLHAMENAGMVVLHKLSDLNKYFLSVDGYFKWK